VTPAIQEWVKAKIDAGMIRRDGDTLEIGSRNVNGTVRGFFTGRYTGMDLEAGPCVDIVGDAHSPLNYHFDTYDTVICLEMLEHDTRPWYTVDNMYAALKIGGIMLISVPTNGFPEHKYPVDLFRFLPDAFPHFFFEHMDVLALDTVSSVPGENTLIGIARKR
jgi:predicted SAM-dependent methyltransferase